MKLTNDSVRVAGVETEVKLIFPSKEDKIHFLGGLTDGFGENAASYDLLGSDPVNDFLDGIIEAIRVTPTRNNQEMKLAK